MKVNKELNAPIYIKPILIRETFDLKTVFINLSIKHIYTKEEIINLIKSLMPFEYKWWNPLIIITDNNKYPVNFYFVDLFNVKYDILYTGNDGNKYRQNNFVLFFKIME